MSVELRLDETGLVVAPAGHIGVKEANTDGRPVSGATRRVQLRRVLDGVVQRVSEAESLGLDVDVHGRSPGLIAAVHDRI